MVSPLKNTSGKKLSKGFPHGVIDSRFTDIYLPRLNIPYRRSLLTPPYRFKGLLHIVLQHHGGAFITPTVKNVKKTPKRFTQKFSPWALPGSHLKRLI